MDANDVARFLQDLLVDRDRRLQLKDQCAERLSSSSSAAAAAAVSYSDQAVLANLDWGIDALEDALSTSNPEAKLARLDHAHRLLQVPALLDPSLSTASVPNSYLSAWAHLHLALLSLTRAAPQDAAFHALHMFAVDPFFSRVDFAPELWQSLFLPHMGSIVGWYSEARHRIVMDSIPDSGDLSLTFDFDEHFFSESLILSVRPDQAEKLRELERVYAESLDENTRMFARYYKDVLGEDSSAAGRKGMVALPPIAEPPMTPLHEVSRSIPDFVKFGPILPKSAGFRQVLGEGDKDDHRSVAASDDVTTTRCSIGSTPQEEASDSSTCTEKMREERGQEMPTPRLAGDPSDALVRSRTRGRKVDNDDKASVTSNSAEEPKDSTKQIFTETLLEENEDGDDIDGSDFDNSETVPRNLLDMNAMRSKMDKGSVTKITSSRKKDVSASRNIYSPVDSPKTPPKFSSLNSSAASKKEPDKLLRLLSNRVTSPLFSYVDYPEKTSPVFSSPNMLKESEPLQNLLSRHTAPILVSPIFCNTRLVESDDESKVRKSCSTSFTSAQHLTCASTDDHVSIASFYSEGEDEVDHNSSSLASSEKPTPRMRPPKDFVCPITGQLFSDPVTLETGQTFERKAIQEWLQRGNTTCPITRQLLSSTGLPQTNYVLRRLITSWIEQNPEIVQEFPYSDSPSASLSPISSREFPLETTTLANFDLLLAQTRTNALKNDRRSKRFMTSTASNSPTSVISQALSEAVMNELKPHTLCLCTSETLQECEAAVLAVAKIWKDSKSSPGIHAYLSKPAILNGFIEVLSASISKEVLRTSIYVLSELVLADESVGEILSSIDSDFDCLAALLINGLAEAVVLVYQLRPTLGQLSNHNLVPSLLQVIRNKGKKMDDVHWVMEPKDAAIAMLEQILSGGDENSRSLNALSVISANGLPVLIKCLDRKEGRLSIVSILLSCMHADKRCRNLIAKRAELGPVLEIFHAGNDCTRSTCIDFISQLICLNRRTFCNQILQVIKDEGAFSTMHSLLVYLQMAPIEQQPIVASLLLQLDLLVEPRKMSIYREDTIDAIIEALKRKDFPVCQLVALDTLLSLSGRLTASGEPLIEAWLLKCAGVDQPYDAAVKEDGMQIVDFMPEEAMEEEEKAMSAWEKRVAFVLCNHDKGAIFKALEECLRSNSMEMAKSCLVTVTWLIHMLSILPDTGIKMVASQCLVDRLIDILQSSMNLEEKVLATLALKSFISDPDALKEIGTYAKRICKPLRKLKRCSPVVADTLKAIMNLPSVDATDFWSCTELFEEDSCPNGEVLSLVHLKGRLFSSHSDGTIKMWDTGRRGLRLIQQVREHSKAVSCLYIPSAGNKLYSGSHDKTIRVWTIEPEEIVCVQVHDMKETVQCLTTNTDLVCFASQGTGAKVSDWNGVPKHVNFNKNVKCLAMAENNLYCGCTGYNIQEVDLSKYTSTVLYSGTRKLLGKQTIHALCIQDGILYAGGSSVDGIAGKAFSLSTKTATGSFFTGLDIHCISLSSDFVFTGTKCGVIEVWLRERLTKVGSIKVGNGASTKVVTMASDSDGEMLFSGSSDGKIQVWGLD